jgi:hypothetical protein
MQSSPILVLSIEYNIRKFLKSKNANIEKLNIYKQTSSYHYKRSREYIITNCKRIYNDIENHFYTYKDFAIFILDSYIIKSKFQWHLVNSKNINITRSFYNQARFSKDEKMILEIAKNLKIKNLNKFFEIKENGNSILYDLIIHEKRFISPIFHIKYENIVFENLNENTKSERYKLFTKLTKIIKKILSKQQN